MMSAERMREVRILGLDKGGLGCFTMVGGECAGCVSLLVLCELQGSG